MTGSSGSTPNSTAVSTAAHNLIHVSVPKRVAMLLTEHKSQAIFDRYNIINEQKLLDAGDQLVAYLVRTMTRPELGARRSKCTSP